MNTRPHKEMTHPPWKDEQYEGIVVWDQKGLVVLCPDYRCSRFSWLALRQACPCGERQAQLAFKTAPPHRR